MKINYFGNSDKGMVREENQDSLGKFPEDSNDLNRHLGLLFIVADGMGGHAKGKDASILAVDEIQNVYFSEKYDSIAENIKIAFQSANSKIFNRYVGDQQFQKMGTTASAIVLHQNKATIAHVGDSRIYRVHQGKIELLTSDHTLVAEMQKKGIINKEEAKRHPDKSILNRAIGIEENIEVDIIKNITLHPGNIFVLCTDGLAKVTADEILKVASENSPEIATSILINMANERGGRDNVTVQIIKLEDEAANKPKNIYEADKVLNKKWIKYLLILFILSALIIFGILFYRDILNIFKSSDVSPESQHDSELPIDMENSNEKSELSLLVSKAEVFYNDAEYDSSASAYKLILRKYPMHLSSLNGLYNIAQKYIEKGNIQKRAGNYYEALELYRKALQLQPEDSTIESLIESSRSSLIVQSNQTKIDDQIEKQEPVDQKKNTIAVEKQAEEKKPAPVNPKYNLPKNSFWNLDDLLNEDYIINGTDIRFKENSRSKKVVNTYVLKDIIVSVKAIFKNISASTSAGIIIGYNWNKSTSVEKYFLFTVEPGKRFVLNEVTDASKKELLSIPYSSETMNDTETYLLSVKYFGAWIMIYSRDKLLKAFYNDSFIVGKVGLYADANTDVEFTNFNIAPAVDNLKE